jgi:hypothetical protein
MTKFDETLAEAYNAQLRESNGKFNQTDRNNLRAKFMDALLADLGGHMTGDGIVMEVEHEYWGSIYIEVNLKMKDPEYDLDAAVEEYQSKLAKAEEKRKAAEIKANEAAIKREATKKPQKV